MIDKNSSEEKVNAGSYLISNTNREQQNNAAPSVRGNDAGSLANITGVPGEQLLQTWVERIVAQDQQAFANLYQSLTGRIYGFVLRITHSAPLAEEITEDTFWQVWRQAPRFDPERGTVIAWILTIARSRALDALRRDAGPAQELELDALETCEANADPGPADLLAAMQNQRRLQQAIGKLEAIPRQLLALSFFRGLSHEEIAHHTQLPLGSVKSHIRRALLNLRQALAEQE